MADRFWMSISIGGDPGEHRGELEELIYNAGFEGHDEDEQLNLNGCEFRSDDLDELAEFCRNHGLPYNVQGEAKYEFDGVICWWRPGMEAERQGFCLQCGRQTFTSEALYEAIASGISLGEFLEMNMVPEMPAFVHGELESAVG